MWEKILSLVSRFAGICLLLQSFHASPSRPFQTASRRCLCGAPAWLLGCLHLSSARTTEVVFRPPDAQVNPLILVLRSERAGCANNNHLRRCRAACETQPIPTSFVGRPAVEKSELLDLRRSVGPSCRSWSLPSAAAARWRCPPFECALRSCDGVVGSVGGGTF